MGGTVAVEPGVYSSSVPSSSVVSSSTTMFLTLDYHGRIECSAALSCRLSGAGSPHARRRVLAVDGTGGGELAVSGIKFVNGAGDGGGGGGGGLQLLRGRVEVMACTFSANDAGGNGLGGAIAVSSGGQLSLSAVAFTSNTALSFTDVFAEDCGTAVVSGECGEGFEGSGGQGERIDVGGEGVSGERE